MAAEALAYYQWSGSYEYLASCPCQGTEPRAILYAVLGDQRAVPWIIEQYQIVSNRYRTKPQFGYQAKMTFLNALYHLASLESLPFIEEVVNMIRTKDKGKSNKSKRAIIQEVKDTLAK